MENEQLYDFVAQRTARCKILVVGDVMLDKYYYGEVTRISPEAPVPITHVLETKETLGGAANVAHNLALLGCETSIAGFVGEDYHCQSLLDKFTARGIDYHGLITTDRPTTTKLRVIGGHQQMMRLDFEESAPITGPYADRFLHYINQKLNESLDCVIISDYGKGSCTEQNCQKIIQACHAHGVPVVVDPKGTNWAKYAHADYITPNLKEINAVLLEPIRNEDKAVEKAAHYVMRSSSCATSSSRAPKKASRSCARKKSSTSRRRHRKSSTSPAPATPSSPSSPWPWPAASRRATAPTWPTSPPASSSPSSAPMPSAATNS
jgi:rfaE bifunctional protein kinase chain/domain